VTFLRGLASGSKDGTVKIWDVNSGQCVHTLRGHTGGITSVAFSRDSTWLASASDDETIKIWDVNSGACLRTLKSYDSFVKSISFSQTRLASASWDTTVKILDADSGECLHALKGHSEFVDLVAFSHDSTRLASASLENIVKIWDANNGTCLQTLEGYSNRVRYVAFSHDTTKLGSATDDKTVKLWDASSEACLQTLNIDKTLLSLSLDSTDCFLHSEIGSIAIHGPGTSSEIVVVEPARPQYRGTSLSSDSIWIKYDGRNMLWIPSEYRPSCFAVCGNRVGMGVGTDRVWTCRIDLGRRALQCKGAMG
jgi:WD40 repeat protein